MNKFVLSLAALTVFALSSCSDSSDEDPTPAVGDAEFSDAGATFNAYAGDSFEIKIKDFDATLHVLSLNDVTIKPEVLETKDGNTTVRIVIPPRVGSGRLVLKNADGEKQGPTITYNKQYVRVFLSQYYLGSEMTRLPNDVMAFFDGTDMGMKLLKYSGFTSTSNVHQAVFDVTGSMINQTEFENSMEMMDYEHGGAGMVASPDGETLYYFLRAGDKSGIGKWNNIMMVPAATLTNDHYTPEFYASSANYEQLGRVSSLASDSKGNLFTVEHQRHYIHKVSGGVVTRFAGSDVGGSTEGTGTAATFQTLQGIAIDGQDNLYVADSNRICKITPAGVVTTFAGSTEAGNRDGALGDARFEDLAAIAVGDDGTLYVYDRGNKRVRIINAAHTQVSTLHTNDGLTFEPGAHDFGLPMTVDSHGNVYLLQSSVNANDTHSSHGFNALLYEDNIPAEIFDGIITKPAGFSWSADLSYSN